MVRWFGLDGGDGLSIAAASQVVGKERGTASAPCKGHGEAQESTGGVSSA